MKRFNNRVRNLSLTLIGLLIIALSIAYAYMAPLIGESAKTKVDIISSTLDKLTFEQGDPIALTINLETLGEGQGNESGSTTSSVKLVANNATNGATKYYDVIFDIELNEFIYTTQNNTPEIILTIKDQNNNDVTSISGLTYVSQGGVSGFDITEYEEKITVKSEQEITTTSSTTGTTHIWTAIITFMNLDTDQSEIEGKTMSANLIIKEHKVTFASIILLNNGGQSHIESKTAPNFSNIATTNEGMFAAADDYGTSYYFRGAVDNNWVKFADYYWRIVRINGDGSVKLIYSGPNQPKESEAVVLREVDEEHSICFGYCLEYYEYQYDYGNPEFDSCINSCYQFKTTIGKIAYNWECDSAEYIGYMYTMGVHRGHEENSTIKEKIDEWYENNLVEYTDYLSDFIVCNDRNFTTANWTPIGMPSSGNYRSDTNYGFTSSSPKLMCTTKEDSYTVYETNIGNGQLQYPIGLLTLDEVQFAGNNTWQRNEEYYLFTWDSYRLVSPANVDFSLASVYCVSAMGEIVNQYGTHLSTGVRPVISLSPDVSVSGSGHWDDPYIIAP